MPFSHKTTEADQKTLIMYAGGNSNHSIKVESVKPTSKQTEMISHRIEPHLLCHSLGYIDRLSLPDSERQENVHMTEPA